jgi:hypothetical protein
MEQKRRSFKKDMRDLKFQWAQKTENVRKIHKANESLKVVYESPENYM